MKLSEVIKAIEDGSKSEFFHGSTKINERDGFVDVHSSFALLVIDGWEEVKPPRQWSGDENKLIELFPWTKYFTRERNGDVLLSEIEPERIEDTYESYWCVESGKFVVISFNEEVKTDIAITFEESPIYIGDLKGE